MKPYSIAGIQMYVTSAESNIPRMRHKVDSLMATYPWIQMVIFSELAPFGPLTSKARRLPCPEEQEFQALAVKHGIWLIPGSMFELRDDGKIYNTASVINPHGEVVGRYSKMFPFYPYEEGVEPGDQFLIWDVPEVGRFGITICYDMWFPETSRTLAAHGVEVIIHPTLTATIDREIELALAQATAGTNQCFIFDINGLGDGGTGRSIICGPDGRVIYQGNVGEELIPIELDLDRVKRSREIGVLRLGQPLKSFRDRKVHFDVYNPGATTPYLQSLGPLIKPTRMRTYSNGVDLPPGDEPGGVDL
jgi:predicted amidohydrolase